jgi:DNA sulfur modification protein DndD
MWIESVRLKNFRIYADENRVDFEKKDGKNIAIIAGKNGFGKTTFLTSLIWGFYGGLMAHVEEKYKRDIRSTGGYPFYLDTLINNEKRRAYQTDEASNAKVEVEIHLVDVMIPSIPCRKVVIKRSYDLKGKKESLKILIDGQENELTKEIGYEVFINDFILPREIAKFFFFDAEKIVSLAEARSKVELRALSKAYSEVLGIKKYEDLKLNLSTLLSKLKRSGATEINQDKLDRLRKEESELTGLIAQNESQQKNTREDIYTVQSRIDKLQEKLIREGNSITLEELKELNKQRDQLKKDGVAAKNELKKLMDIVPFVIAKTRLKELVDQINKEFALKNANIGKKELKVQFESVAQEFDSGIADIVNDPKALKDISEYLSLLMTKQLSATVQSEEGEILLDFDDAKARSILATYDYINNSFPSQFDRIKKREKDIAQHLGRIQKKIREGEARKSNPLAQKLREEKAGLIDRLADYNQQLIDASEEAGELKVKFASNQRVLSELEKSFNLVETDREKYKVTLELLEKLNVLTARIKEEKKYSLQKAILFGLRKLMHKENFIHDVSVRIEDDIMDIDLLDVTGNVIDKDNLSKGEQQLYATALLKALVDESGINFPVFIDSPLQKFDKQHSSNVIKQFYPNISDQVVLFPLLEKELTEKEYELLKPNLSSVHLIQNSLNGSTIEGFKTKELFTQFQAQDVHAH